jgi:type II secretory pathway pseudopilin PulG
MERWQRFMITVLVILLVALLIMVRLMIDLNELRRQTNTQHLLEQVARQVEMYRSARGFLPQGLDDLSLDIPDDFTDGQGDPVDGWGNALLYYHSDAALSEEYVIASPGRDGAFEVPPDAYLQRRAFSSTRGRPDADTVLVSGRVVQGAVEKPRR